MLAYRGSIPLHRESDTRRLTVYPSDAVGCGVEHPWIRLVCLPNPKNGQSDWDLGTLEALVSLSARPHRGYDALGLLVQYYHGQH